MLPNRQNCKAAGLPHPRTPPQKKGDLACKLTIACRCCLNAAQVRGTTKLQDGGAPGSTPEFKGFMFISGARGHSGISATNALESSPKQKPKSMLGSSQPVELLIVWKAMSTGLRLRSLNDRDPQTNLQNSGATADLSTSGPRSAAEGPR